MWYTANLLAPSYQTGTLAEAEPASTSGCLQPHLFVGLITSTNVLGASTTAMLYYHFEQEGLIARKT